MTTLKHSLSIIIPAYNEEQAIEAICKRASLAVPELRRQLDLEFVEIIVVNDGSIDGTLSILQRQTGIKVISYPDNRGYGYAIKRGFELAGGSLVGFLDADGTCDPQFFALLCAPIIQDQADMTLGNRMSATSRMPPIRKLGNRIYALILRILAGKVVHDTASGIRVIRRSILAHLYPLPDGLHFTPAMSAKALLDPTLRIAEIPMHYEERVGESKLKVWKDGFRFLRIILLTAIAYHPRNIYRIPVVMGLITAGIYSVSPIRYYLAFHRIEDPMYYRLSTITILLILSSIFWGVGVLNDKLTYLRLGKPTQAPTHFDRYVGWTGIALVLAGIGLNSQGIMTYLLYRKVYLHWVYILCGGTWVILGFILLFIKIISAGIDFIREINDYQDCMPLDQSEFERKHQLRVMDYNGSTE